LLPPPSSAVLSNRQQPSVAVEQWLKGKVEADAPSFAQDELPPFQQLDGKYPLDRSGRQK
jgi:hypothetical protein